MPQIKKVKDNRLVHIRVPDEVVHAVCAKAQEERRTMHSQLVVILEQWAKTAQRQQAAAS